MMSNPTPEQIAAAAKIISPDGVFSENFSEYSRKRDNYREIDQVEEQDYYLQLAESALVAAEGVTPRGPAVTEAELNRIISPVLFNSMNYPDPHRMLGKDFSKLRGALVRALIEGLTELEPQG